MNIGLRIKELANQEKLEISDLAVKLGKTKQAVYDMMSKQDLNTSVLRELAVIFKVPKLSVQRDIFIFQCLVGCRVSDLRKLTRANVSGGFLEYVPGKTKKERAETVRVPLNGRAKALLEKYAESFSVGSFSVGSFSVGSFSVGSFFVPLFPFVSPQKYNDAIKKIFRLCGIDRLVTILDPVTGEERKRPICEVASSHMARRTFIGNIYKKVKDINLVGSMTGHKEGSRAFSRYREIDDEIKKKLVSLIE